VESCKLCGMTIDPGSDTNSANQDAGEQRQRLLVLEETLTRVRNQALSFATVAPNDGDICSLCKPYVRDIVDPTSSEEL